MEKVIYGTCNDVKFKIDKDFYIDALEESEINCNRVFCPKRMICSECPLGDEEKHKVDNFEIK